MPLTFGHPAAILPLRGVLGESRSVPSALVIGSVAPDLAYVVPLWVSRGTSHSIVGLFTFCLPVGLAVFLLYHLYLKRALLSLAPTALYRRLAVFEAAPRLPPVPWWAVVVSLLLGSLTHLAWDSFTHERAAAVRSLEVLRATLFSVGPIRVTTYKLLQHVSTVLGLGVLGWWWAQWLRNAPRGAERSEPQSRAERWMGVILLVVLPPVLGCVLAARNVKLPAKSWVIQDAIGRAVHSSFATFCLAIIAYGAWWHVRSRRRIVAIEAGAHEDR